MLSSVQLECILFFSLYSHCNPKHNFGIGTEPKTLPYVFTTVACGISVIVSFVLFTRLVTLSARRTGRRSSCAQQQFHPLCCAHRVVFERFFTVCIAALDGNRTSSYN